MSDINGVEVVFTCGLCATKVRYSSDVEKKIALPSGWSRRYGRATPNWYEENDGPPLHDAVVFCSTEHMNIFSEKLRDVVATAKSEAFKTASKQLSIDWAAYLLDQKGAVVALAELVDGDTS